MRRAAEALLRAGLQFDEEGDRVVFERGDPAPTEWSKRPIFLSGSTSQYAVLLDHYWKPDAKYHYLVLSLDQDFPRGELTAEWKRLTQWSEEIVGAVAPHFAFAWATESENAKTPFHYETLRQGALPPHVSSWTVFGGHCLTPGIRQHLGTLPAYRSEAFADGWLLQALQIPGTPPPKDFGRALQAIENMEYVDPLLE
jgi:hypothetical protein